MILSTERPTGPSKEAALALLDDTMRSVKVMKASWLRVALNLQKIRQHEVWRLHPSGCSSFEEYVYGVLDIARGVAQRMLHAVDYTRERRPDFLADFESGRGDLHVPSYDTLDKLRRAAGAFAGRESEFDQIESRVFEEGLGRVSLRRELDDWLGRGAGPGNELRDEHAEEGGPAAEPDLGAILEALADIEKQLLRLGVSKEARQLMFRLVETLQKERGGRRKA